MLHNLQRSRAGAPLLVREDGPRYGRDSLDEMHDALRLRHRSPRTAEAYLGWVRRFLSFYPGRAPRSMGGAEVTQFLTHLAVEGRVQPSTQNQALAALLFLYRDVLRIDLPWMKEIVHARRRRKLPVVFSLDEVSRVLARLQGTPRLFSALLYGSGLRLMEGLRLRVKDVDFARGDIVVRSGKGDRDRGVLFPESLREPLTVHLDAVATQWRSDLARGAGWVELRGALERKYPNAGREWGWQWIFPATRLYLHEKSGQHRRHHLHETLIQREVRQGARRRHRQARDLSHLPPLLRDPSPRIRRRHSNRAGAPRPQRRPHDHDLHPCAERTVPPRA